MFEDKKLIGLRCCWKDYKLWRYLLRLFCLKII